MQKAGTERFFDRAFIALVLLTVLDRAWMVHTTMGHASDDLAVVWLAATDYARGIFHEPFFYGQDYGVMLEALLAAPFVASGLEPVLPVAILFGFFAIIPYLAFAFHHRARGERGAALLFAAMPVLLPVENGLQITALNGIALLALVPLALRAPRNWQCGFLLTLLLGLAAFVNPNAALLAAPIAFDHLWRNRDKGTLAGMASGILPVLMLSAGARSYFARQDTPVVNTIFDWRMRFEPDLLGDAVQRLDMHFAWTVPLCGDHGALALLLLVAVAAVLLRQRQYGPGWAVIGTLALIVLAFCFAKVHDGADSIFFPMSRVFLAMPLVIAWSWSKVRLPTRWMPTFSIMIAVVATIHTAYRLTQAGPTYANELLHQQGLPVRTWPVDRIRERCAVVAELAVLNAVDRIVILRGEDPYAAQFVAYALPTFHPEAPDTWMVGHDRRTFQRGDPYAIPVNKVLVVGGSNHELQRAMRVGHVSALLRTHEPLALVLRVERRSIGQVIDGFR